MIVTLFLTCGLISLETPAMSAPAVVGAQAEKTGRAEVACGKVDAGAKEMRFNPHAGREVCCR